MCIDFFDIIYLLTAIGLPPGDSSTVHIYTQTIPRTTQLTNFFCQINSAVKFLKKTNARIWYHDLLLSSFLLFALSAQPNRERLRAA